jgi:hypothetical protein
MFNIEQTGVFTDPYYAGADRSKLPLALQLALLEALRSNSVVNWNSCCRRVE